MPVRTVKVPSATLGSNRQHTHFTADTASGVSNISVKNISGIAINTVLLLGDFGVEGSEIVKTHAVTAPSGSTVTLKATTTTSFAHSAYTKVTVLAYDQIEVSHAETLTGNKSVLATVDIQSDRSEHVYDDSTQTSGYYFYRYKNSLTSTYSDYSDGTPYGGDEENTVNYALSYALTRNDTQLDSKLTDTYILQEVNACLKYITGKRKKWSQLQNFDYKLGQTVAGSRAFTLPSDMYDRTNNKSVLQVRLNGSKRLTYVDKREFDELNRATFASTVRTEALAGDTSLAIVNSYDFPESGSIVVYVNGTAYEITYTGVTRSTTSGALTGIPASGEGAVTVTIPVGTNVWSGEVAGEPLYYTVHSGQLLLHPIPDGTAHNFNVVLDYWTAPTTVNSLGDTLDLFRFDMVQDWLVWSIRAKINNRGEKKIDDPDYIMFQDKLRDAIRTERSGQKYKWIPKLNTIDLTNVSRG